MAGSHRYLLGSAQSSFAKIVATLVVRPYAGCFSLCWPPTSGGHSIVFFLRALHRGLLLFGGLGGLSLASSSASFTLSGPYLEKRLFGGGCS